MSRNGRGTFQKLTDQSFLINAFSSCGHSNSRTAKEFVAVWFTFSRESSAAWRQRIRLSPSKKLNSSRTTFALYITKLFRLISTLLLALLSTASSIAAAFLIFVIDCKTARFIIETFHVRIESFDHRFSNLASIADCNRVFVGDWQHCRTDRGRCSSLLSSFTDSGFVDTCCHGNKTISRSGRDHVVALHHLVVYS